MGIDGAIPFVTSPGVQPLCEAVLYRVFKAIPRILDHSAFSTAQRLLEYLLPDFMQLSSPMSAWDWVVSMKNSRRRKALVRALRQYQERGELPLGYDVIKAFVKSELLPWFGQSVDGPVQDGRKYVARLIQAPNDETHVVAGPYLKPLVHRLKEIWNHENWCFYASVSPDKLDKWINRVSQAQSWFWSDYSAYDSTWSDAAWDLVEGMYRNIYPDAHPDFWKVLEAWRKPSGRMNVRQMDGLVVRYQADTCNASGRDDTALANALLNGIVLMMSFASVLSRKHLSALNRDDLYRASQLVDIAIVGDDSLVACKFDVEPYRQQLKTCIESFGLIVEEQCSRELVDVTFLGMMPYPVGGKYYWGPTLGRRLYKAFWQREPIGNLPAWTRGVAKQLMLYKCCPVLYDMAKRVDELLAGHHATVWHSMRHSREMTMFPDENRVWTAREGATPQYDASTLAWLAYRYRDYGLNVTSIKRDISIIGEVDRLPAVLQLRTTTVALAADDL
nr:MAG: RNA-dependent RNA polymerase [Chemarfal virus 155]